MPIKYDVFRNGHFIHAVASGVMTGAEFIEFEVAHPTDERVKAPLYELFEIQDGATVQLSKEDIEKVLKMRKEIETLPTPHKCAIVISYVDSHAWDLAKYYEGMVTLHYPESVIVFGDIRTARIWLGVEDVSKEERVIV
jgi:hypothetical protein